MSRTDTPGAEGGIQLLDVHLTFEGGDEQALSSLRARYAAPEFRRVRRSGSGSSCVAVTERRGMELELEDEMTLRLLETSRDFLLVHAAALARNGRGVILVGPPFAGKTTLALGLVERGLEFYSDDLAPLLRGQGVLYPYRRSAAVRTEEGGREFRDLWKWGKGGRQEPPIPCRLGWVFILDEPPGAGAPEGGAPEWSIIIAPGSLDLEQALGTCADLRIVHRCESGNNVRYDLARAPGADSTTGFRELIARWPEQVVYAGPRLAAAKGRGEWACEPALRPITRREAALEILRHTLNRGYADQLQRLYGAHPHLKAYADILEALEGAVCFRVRSGHLQHTLDLLVDTIDRDDPRSAAIRSTAA